MDSISLMQSFLLLSTKCQEASSLPTFQVQLPSSEDDLHANQKFLSEFKAHLMVWLSGENRIAGKDMVQAFLLFNQSSQSKKGGTVHSTTALTDNIFQFII